MKMRGLGGIPELRPTGIITRTKARRFAGARQTKIKDDAVGFFIIIVPYV